MKIDWTKAVVIVASVLMSGTFLYSTLKPVQNLSSFPANNPCASTQIQVFGTSPANGHPTGGNLTTIKGCNFRAPDVDGQHTWVYFGQAGGCTPQIPTEPPTVGPRCLIADKVQFVDPSTLVVLVPSMEGSKILAAAPVDITVYVK